MNEHVHPLIAGVLEGFAVAKKTRWEVQENNLCGGWENNWTDENDQPVTFASKAAAEKELRDHLESVKEAVARGDMQEEYDPEDYRVVPVGT